MHPAGQALGQREHGPAPAPGTTLTISDRTAKSFSRTRTLSPTGRRRTFDAAADDAVRGEDREVVVLSTGIKAHLALGQPPAGKRRRMPPSRRGSSRATVLPACPSTVPPLSDRLQAACPASPRRPDAWAAVGGPDASRPQRHKRNG
ncbi:beta-ketoacyl synthase N-terminal-like domain-containing protein [Kitasatospora sp. NPDC001683]